MNVFHKDASLAQPSMELVDDQENILRSMWRKSYFGLSAIGLFTVIFNILRLSTAVYALTVLDRVLASRSVETLVMLTIIVVVAVAAGALLGVIRRVMFLRWGGWIERELGPRMFQIGISSASASQSPSALLRDVGKLRGFVSGSGLVSWIDVLFAPFFLAVVFLISPEMGLIVLIASLLILILGVANELATRGSRSAAYVARADDDGWVASVERNRETVGPLNMSANFADLWFRSVSERLDESDQTRKTNIYFLSAMRFVRRCLRIAVLGFGVWLVIQGSLTIGAVIASYYVGRTGFSMIQQAMLKWREMVNARRCYYRIRSALKDRQTLTVSISRNPLPKPLIFDHVGFRYPKHGVALFRNVDISVEPGQALYVIGPSGAGKTTFARLAAGAMIPMSGGTKAGQIRLGDFILNRMVQSGQGNYVGYLPQDVRLFDGTIRENIARMSAGDMDLVIEAAKLAGVHDAIIQLPQGYDTVISDEESLLSAGRKKGVALARAFYGLPSVVVLDEPESHLDRGQRGSLLSAIHSLKAQGSIVVVTTQLRPPTRKIANKVILLENGKAIQIEDPEKIAELRRPKSNSSPTSE